MRPILFDFAGFPIPAWHFFFCVSVLVSLFSFRKLCLALHVSQESRSFPNTFFIMVYVFGFLGARFIGEFESNLLEANLRYEHLQLDGKMTFYGGILGGLFGSILLFLCFPKLRAFFSFKLLDAVLPSVVLGLGIGRLGCLLNGDDYGKVVGESTGLGIFEDLLSVFFPVWANTGPGNQLRYGTQVQESVFSVLVYLMALVAIGLKRRKQTFRIDGVVGLVCAFLSSLNRFFNEFFRGDARGNFFFTDVSFSQGVACVIMVFCVLLFIYCLEKKRYV